MKLILNLQHGKTWEYGIDSNPRSFVNILNLIIKVLDRFPRSNICSLSNYTLCKRIQFFRQGIMKRPDTQTRNLTLAEQALKLLEPLAESEIPISNKIYKFIKEAFNAASLEEGKPIKQEIKKANGRAHFRTMFGVRRNKMVQNEDEKQPPRASPKNIITVANRLIDRLHQCIYCTDWFEALYNIDTASDHYESDNHAEKSIVHTICEKIIEIKDKPNSLELFEKLIELLKNYRRQVEKMIQRTKC